MSSSFRSFFAFVPSTLISLFLFASGCGNEGPSPDPLGRGFTDCNGATCQPGQYCRLAAFCENGCLSDVNCTDSQRCVDVGSGTFGEGRCEVAMTMTPDAGGPGPNEQCVRLCNALAHCDPSGSAT
jgi:hypothetical protein